MEQPSLSGTCAMQQREQQGGILANGPHHQQQQRQVQVQPGSTHTSSSPPPEAPEKPPEANLQRLTAALTAVLSSGMASDFVEGLKPVLHNGKLAISTYIKLTDSPEPIFIGMFPSLSAAVAAQKQSQELVGKLPADVAGKIIAQQLAHTEDVSTAAAQPSGSDLVVPERLQSNTTSDITAVGAPACSPAVPGTDEGGDATPKAPMQHFDSIAPDIPQQKQQHRQQQDRRAEGPAGQAAGEDMLQQHLEPDHAAAEQGKPDHAAVDTAAVQSALAAAAAAAAEAATLATGSQQAAAGNAGASQQPLSALTDDVIRLLLHKGLHALTMAQGHTGEGGSSMQQQQLVQEGQKVQQQQQQDSTLGMLSHLVSAAADASATADAAGKQQQSSPDHCSGVSQGRQQSPLSPLQQQQHHQQQQRHELVGPQGVFSSLVAQSGYEGVAGGRGGQEYLMQQQQQFSTLGSQQPPAMVAASHGLSLLDPSGNMGAGFAGASSTEAALVAAAAAAAGGGLGGMVNVLGAADHLPYSQAPVSLPYSTGGILADHQQLPAASFQQDAYLAQQMGSRMPGMDGGALPAPYAAAAGAFNHLSGGYLDNLAMQQQMAAGFGMQFGAAAAAGPGGYSTGLGSAAAAAAAAEAAEEAAGGGVGEKRKRSDPRLNCIKSVQYRVSRFPSELHDLCIEHWERARCARVVCNGVQGVMSVQGGRCVVTFNQNNTEVVKGVADFLRYAGEDRIKKWRRHVRMVDFPRPNNRTGELMTAEEFLCIVGYQSEQGGGKRARSDLD